MRFRFATSSRTNIPRSRTISGDHLYILIAFFTNRFFSTRLAEILRHKAALLEHIVSDQRYYPDYFRVAFYGTSFPVAIRNKQFVVSTTFSWNLCEELCLLSCSIEDMNGRSSERSANACWTSIRDRSYLERWANHLLTFALVLTSIFNVLQFNRNQIDHCPYSTIPTSLLPCGCITSTGAKGIFSS